MHQDDPRLEQLADVLLEYSTQTKTGDRVWITASEIETLPLAVAIYRRALQFGALPYVETSFDLFEREMLSHGSSDQLNWVPEPTLAGMKWADVYIGLRAAPDVVPIETAADRLVAHRRVLGTLSARRTAETRWVLVPVPSAASARRAGLSMDEMIELFFAATLKDWTVESAFMRKLAIRFASGTNVRIVGDGTDLSFSTAGRKYELADGHYNMPDGEVYTAPEDDSAEGVITFESANSYAGHNIPGIRLSFAGGQVVHADAHENIDLLREVLNMDDGSRRIGEFGLGTNSAIKRVTGDVLLDEKIGGTIHIALGRAYAECGGINDSALHWDLVKDLRTEGAVLVDGRPAIERGRVVG